MSDETRAALADLYALLDDYDARRGVRFRAGLSHIRGRVDRLGAALALLPTTTGICGDPASRIVGFGDGVPDVVCALPAGHAGWHAEDSGMKWSTP